MSQFRKITRLLVFILISGILFIGCSSPNTFSLTPKDKSFKESNVNDVVNPSTNANQTSNPDTIETIEEDVIVGTNKEENLIEDNLEDDAINLEEEVDIGDNLEKEESRDKSDEVCEDKDGSEVGEEVEEKDDYEQNDNEKDKTDESVDTCSVDNVVIVSNGEVIRDNTIRLKVGDIDIIELMFYCGNTQIFIDEPCFIIESSNSFIARTLSSVVYSSVFVMASGVGQCSLFVINENEIVCEILIVVENAI